MRHFFFSFDGLSHSFFPALFFPFLPYLSTPPFSPFTFHSIPYTLFSFFSFPIAFSQLLFISLCFCLSACLSLPLPFSPYLSLSLSFSLSFSLSLTQYAREFNVLYLSMGVERLTVTFTNILKIGNKKNTEGREVK